MTRNGHDGGVVAAGVRAALVVSLAGVIGGLGGEAPRLARGGSATVSERVPTNHLAHEASPYLQQHARNPVDWYPWGPEALALARAQDKPIFLSIGYAACHWCHVMERESFEDAATAAVLNGHFVAIKVDREERPDLDAVYMTAVQAMTGSGGWPLSVFLTPELKPFFGGTYFPPERRYGMASFREVLLAVADAWRTRRSEVESGAAGVAAHLSRSGAAHSDAMPDLEAAARSALATLGDEYDPRSGGFGSAPKFPAPSRLFFLLDRARSDPAALRMLSGTLDAMAAGGMYDWLGGGFHRYSVDGEWLIPHFEKMLYDNALLARAYGEAGLELGRAEWVRVARETADYLLREMRGPEGGFFSSTDADSEGREGLYFTWSPTEVRAAVPPRQADLILDLCPLTERGNFEGGRSVLRPARSLAEVAGRSGLAPDAAAALLVAAREGLLEARRRRVPPATDDKRLAAWNGMAIWALAYLGAALPEPRYLEAARAAARFALSHAGPGGFLTRSWRAGRRSGVETLEDVAWVAAGLVQLYEADGQVEWLASARAIATRRLPRYLDGSGALYDTPDDGPALLMRPHGVFDGATPSSAAVAVSVASRIAALTEDRPLRFLAERAARAEAGRLLPAPEHGLAFLQAALAVARPPVTLVVVGDPAWASTRTLLATAWRHLPRSCALAVSDAVPVPPASAAAVPLFVGREPGNGERGRAYLCEGGACRLPVEDPAELARALDGLPR